jgi:Icc protein
MTNIAHLSDLHLLEDGHARRRRMDRLRLSLLTLGRELDADDREERLVRALRNARPHAEHLVVSGDLTEDGVDAQFERLALVLHDSAWKPHEVTLVPGNHDAYTDGAAWSRGLAGPLASYAPTSEPGAVTITRSAVIVAVSTAMSQSIGRAAGRVGEAQLARIRRIVETHGDGRRAIVLVMHHGPEGFGLPRRIVDGLVDEGAVRALMQRHRNMYVLCGHTHRSTDRALQPQGAARIFTAPSVVSHPSPLRLHATADGVLTPIEHDPPVARRDAARLLFRAMRDASPAL